MTSMPTPHEYLGNTVTLSSLWKERLGARGRWAVYQCKDQSSPQIGQVTLVAFGPGCAHSTPPPTASHWSRIFVGVLDLDNMLLRGTRDLPVVFREEEEVQLIYDKESGPKTEPLPVDQLYRVRVRAKTVSSRGKGWQLCEVRGLASLKSAYEQATRDFPSKTHEVFCEAGFERGARWVWYRVKL